MGNGCDMSQAGACLSASKAQGSEEEELLSLKHESEQCGSPQGVGIDHGLD